MTCNLNGLGIQTIIREAVAGSQVEWVGRKLRSTRVALLLHERRLLARDLPDECGGHCILVIGKRKTKILHSLYQNQWLLQGNFELSYNP